MFGWARGFVPAWFMEGMILLAVVGVVLAIAIPALVTGKARADISHALQRVQPATDAVAAFFARTGKMPRDNVEVGAAQLKALEGGSVKAIRVSDGVIEVELAGGFWTLNGKLLLLRPAVFFKDPMRPLQWVCQDGPAPDGWIVMGQGPLVNGVERDYLPQSCRQQ
jgi:hypothetical protein